MAKSKFDKIETQPQEEAKLKIGIFDVVGRYRFYKGDGKIGFGESLDMGSLDSSDEEKIGKVKYTITEQARAMTLDQMKRTGISPSLIDLQKDVETSFNLIPEEDNPYDDVDKPVDFWEMIIIPQDSKILYVWKAIFMISCLTSSYFYAYVAAFYHPDEGWWLRTELIYELIFLVDIGVNVITEYYEEGAPNPTRDISSIIIRYLKSTFILDLIPIIPLMHMNFEIENFSSRHFYVLKCIRIYKSQDLFNVQKIYAKLKNFMNKRLA